MDENAELVVTRVLGTGNPFDAIMLIPLIHQWGATRACATETAEPCEAPLRRIVILAEPGLTDDTGMTSRTLAYCEPHYQSFIEAARSSSKVETGPKVESPKCETCDHFEGEHHTRRSWEREPDARGRRCYHSNGGMVADCACRDFASKVETGVEK